MSFWVPLFFMPFFENQEILLNIEFAGLTTASSLGFMMGLADDAYNTKPFLGNLSCNFYVQSSSSRSYNSNISLGMAEHGACSSGLLA
ncbi:MAG: hypothetical protein R2850_08485 [Bacteroidia bacterium]